MHLPPRPPGVDAVGLCVSLKGRTHISLSRKKKKASGEAENKAKIDLWPARRLLWPLSKEEKNEKQKATTQSKNSSGTLCDAAAHARTPAAEIQNRPRNHGPWAPQAPRLCSPCGLYVCFSTYWKRDTKMAHHSPQLSFFFCVKNLRLFFGFSELGEVFRPFNIRTHNNNASPVRVSVHMYIRPRPRLAHLVLCP